MLAPKAPRSVYDHRPVAVQVVKQQESGAVDKYVLIVEEPKKKTEQNGQSLVAAENPIQCALDGGLAVAR